jgi:hypothetical protein
MQFQNAAIALLAGMIFVLAFLVGWLYWQQTRIHQSLNTLAMVLAELTPQQYDQEVQAEEEEEELPKVEDDRQEVETPETVSGPPVDTDDIQSKTRKELQELLSKKGIPFSKTDSKTVLLQLLKAVA